MKVLQKQILILKIKLIVKVIAKITIKLIEKK